MKNHPNFIAWCIGVIILITIFATTSCSGQSYTNNNGKIEKTTKSNNVVVKTPDSVFAVKDGITFYKGSKGGVYYFKVSKKTGKQYKCYVPTKK